MLANDTIEEIVNSGIINLSVLNLCDITSNNFGFNLVNFKKKYERQFFTIFSDYSSSFLSIFCSKLLNIDGLFSIQIIKFRK